MRHRCGVKVFVAGGSGAIGRSVVVRLAGAGTEVAIGYLSRREVAEEVAASVRAAGGRAELVQGDLVATPGALVEESVRRLGGLDAFVNCAGLANRGDILTATADDLRQSVDAHAVSFVLAAQVAANAMPDRRGRIVAVSATGGHRIRNPRYARIAIGKAALETAVRFLAVALAQRGITVNAVAPGPLETRDLPAEEARLRTRLAEVTPMGRLGRPEDVAPLIAFLCSGDAAWLTGQVIFADGGYSLV